MWTFIAIVAGIVAGSIAGLIATVVSDKEHRARPHLATLIGAVLAFAIVQTVAQNQSTDRDTSGGGTTTTPESPVTRTTPVDTDPVSSPPPASSPPLTPPTDEPPPLQATSLLDLPRVAEDTNDDIDLDDANHDQHRWHDLWSRAALRVPDVLQRLVPAGAASDSRTEVQTLHDNRCRPRHQHRQSSHRRHPGQPDTTNLHVLPGHPKKVSLDVNGTRLRVQLYAPGPLKNPIQAGVDSAAGRNGGGLPGVGLGDPIFLP